MAPESLEEAPIVPNISGKVTPNSLESSTHSPGAQIQTVQHSTLVEQFAMPDREDSEKAPHSQVDDSNDAVSDPPRSYNRKVRTPSPELNPKAGENRLRPAGDIINRLIWDPKFERNEYVIGFVDRFEGQLEVGMDSWKKETTDEEFIPQHRVLYIRHISGDIVWDRRRRIDKIFLSGNSAFPELAFLA
ncbi:hypothetical protein N7452_000936 [Penicillium brevicompactum]|uniref:MJ1316 RNA cyclic group end recognition domain-containing protein n=1 Tax=Penicillium brevicompactum TaxID=5074 RepID=A0A9W9R1E3_PENBR|nr:hypothetical protein N7452_000936 [Penicillium brevicompactum]